MKPEGEGQRKVNFPNWKSICPTFLILIYKKIDINAYFLGMLKGYFQANPYRQQQLKVFAKGKAEYYNVILPWNSPLKSILQKASSTFIESGTVDYMSRAWEGKDIPSNIDAEIMILSAGQVFLVFFIVACTFGCAGGVFLCELCHKKINDHEKVKKNSNKGKNRITLVT
jgi:hypothetical protein